MRAGRRARVFAVACACVVACAALPFVVALLDPVSRAALPALTGELRRLAVAGAGWGVLLMVVAARARRTLALPASTSGASSVGGFVGGGAAALVGLAWVARAAFHHRWGAGAEFDPRVVTVAAVFLPVIPAFVGTLLGMVAAQIGWMIVAPDAAPERGLRFLSHPVTGRQWVEIGGRIGLTPLRRTFLTFPILEGTRDGLKVRITGSTGGRLTIRIDSGVRGVGLESRSLGATIRGVEDASIGDARLDRRMVIAGNALVTRSVLTSAVRDRLEEAWSLEGRWRVEDGVVVRDLERADAWSMAELADPVRALAARIRDAGTGPLGERLAARVSDAHEEEAIRLRALGDLLAHFPSAPETVAALVSASADPSAALRLAAAEARGDAVALTALAESVSAEESLRARALRGACARLPPPALRSACERALADPCAALRATALEIAIGAEAHAVGSVVPELGAVAARASGDPDVRVRRAAARVLAGTDGAGHGDAIAARLLVETDVEALRLLIAAAAAHGDASAVEGLHAAAARERALRAPGEGAIARVRARLEGADAGQVSLAAADRRGELAVTDASGRLSEPPSPRRR